jgi:hypothetical protein
MKKVTPLDAPPLFSPGEARCWSIGWNAAVDAMNADRPAAVLEKPVITVDDDNNVSVTWIADQQAATPAPGIVWGDNLTGVVPMMPREIVLTDQQAATHPAAWLEFTPRPDARSQQMRAQLDALDQQPTMKCPKCPAEYEDHDGFGVLHCPACGYCKHASITDSVCDFCHHSPGPRGATA